MRPTSDPGPVAGALLGALLAIAALLSGGRAQAAPRPGVVCTVAPSGVSEADVEALQVALRLEARKGGLAVRAQRVSSLLRCPSDDRVVVVLLAPDGRVTLAGPGAPATSFEAPDATPAEQATELAREALALLPTPGREGVGEALVDVTVPLELPPRPVPAPPVPLGAELSVGGGYAFDLGPDLHRGVLAAEVALRLFDGRLTLGLSGAWAPARASAAGPPEAEVTTGELLGMARGGFRAGPLLLRLGLGAGWQWRQLSVRAPQRFDAVEARSGAAAVALELEALLPLTERLFLTLALPGRVYLGGTEHRWKGAALGDAPRGAVGAVLRAGVAF